MPRPKQPAGQGRQNVLRIRLTEDERARLEAAAEQDGRDLATWARFILLAEAKRPWPTTVAGFQVLLEQGGLEPEVREWIHKVSAKWPLPGIKYYQQAYARFEQNEIIRQYIAKRVLGIPYEPRSS